MMKSSIVLLGVFMNMIVVGQNIAFPQNVKYKYGIMPEYRKHADAQMAYDDWKQHHLTKQGANGGYRVLFDDGKSTVSEGIAYGMLLSVCFGEKEIFDGLWQYYKLHSNENGVMHWMINDKGEVIKANGASDAEEDAAYALYLAHRQWGSSNGINYLKDTKELISIMMEHEVDHKNFMFSPGDKWGDKNTVFNPSYFAPAYYRVFKQLTGDENWDKVIAKGYEILNKAMNKETGLVPDWCDIDGNLIKGRNSHYGFDAARTPWRIAMDYAWFGTPAAQEYCIKITGFAKKTGAANIKDGYEINGTVTGKYHNSTFVGPFGAGAMATTEEFQGFCNQIYIDNVYTLGDTYFNRSIKALTLLFQTGNFIAPDIGD